MKKPTDKEMLDWLDLQGAHWDWKVTLPDDGACVPDCVWVTRNTTIGHKTIRAAIASRMARQRREAKP